MRKVLDILFLIILASSSMSAELIQGVITGSAANILVVRTARGEELIMLEPTTLRVNFVDLSELYRGVYLTVTAGEEKAGVQHALKVEKEPSVALDSLYSISPYHLGQMLRSEDGLRIRLCDCRSEEEFQAGHLPGAAHCTESNIQTRIEGADGVEPIRILYGRNNRDERVYLLFQQAVEAGLRSVKVLEGGAEGWRFGWNMVGRETVVEPEYLMEHQTAPGNLLLIDVRSQKEFKEGTIPGAVSVDLEKMKSFSVTSELFPGPWILFGKNDRDPDLMAALDRVIRSRPQSDLVRSGGIHRLRGGMEGWISNNYPVEQGDPAWSPERVRALAEGAVTSGEFQRIWMEERKTYLFVDLRKKRYVDHPDVIQIPLEELSQRLNDLPADKEVLLFCDWGARAEIGFKILTKNGRSARFLPGPALLR